MPSGGRKFPWRWVIAGLAVAVIAMTLLIPPPGLESETVDDTSDTDETAVSGEIESADPVIIPDTIRVMVLNGTETDGLAGRTQRLLLHSSSDSTVILAPLDPSDAVDKPYPETILISHIADISAAVIIADILGCPEDCIVWEVPRGNASIDVDVTVCLGEDILDEVPVIE